MSTLEGLLERFDIILVRLNHFNALLLELCDMKKKESLVRTGWERVHVHLVPQESRPFS